METIYIHRRSVRKRLWTCWYCKSLLIPGEMAVGFPPPPPPLLPNVNDGWSHTVCIHVHIFYRVRLSPDLIPGGWQGSKHQLANCVRLTVIIDLIKIFFSFIKMSASPVAHRKMIDIFFSGLKSGCFTARWFKYVQTLSLTHCLDAVFFFFLPTALFSRAL